IEALLFAKQLVQELIVGLIGLKGEIDKCASTLSEAIRQYNDRISERISDNGSSDLREHLVRFYQPELVRTVTLNLVKDENEQRTQANRVRQTIVGRLGEFPDFTLFNERFSLSDFLDTLDNECANSARIAHNNLVQNRKERLLGVSII